MHNAIYETREFELKPGLVIAKIEHGGRGECHLQVIPNEHLGSMWLSALTFGAIGHVLKWMPLAYCSEFNDYESPTWGITRVSGRKGDRGSMRPGKYVVEVKSTSRWSCQLIQLALEQSEGSFPHHFRLEGEGGSGFMGPFRTGSRPVLANMRRNGTGPYDLAFMSLDGAHEYIPDILNPVRRGPPNVGRLRLEEQELKLLPCKEYLMMGYGNGTWEVDLSEGP